MKRVLIATDGSDHALKAVELGTELAIKMDGAELHILAVAYYEPSEEVELRKFTQIEHLDGGLMNIAQNLRKAMWHERGSRPRRWEQRLSKPLSL
jgi:nucleotide-binding universal stress UspA family protein